MICVVSLKSVYRARECAPLYTAEKAEKGEKKGKGKRNEKN
jgi:hypothetical protein